MEHELLQRHQEAADARRKEEEQRRQKDLEDERARQAREDAANIEEESQRRLQAEMEQEARIQAWRQDRSRAEEEEEVPDWNDGAEEEDPGVNERGDMEVTEETVETWGNMLRRLGPPSNALIVRPDNRGVWEISPARTLEAVTQVLTVREKALSQLGLAKETRFLPMEGQVHAQKELKELWLHTDLGKAVVEEVGACISFCISRIVSVS
jgi:hypothetical protein